MNIIEFKNVTECFRLYKHKKRPIGRYLIDILRSRKNTYEELLALQDININIKKGEIVGIIGENGSGKTTLLRVIAGILKPDKGIVNIRGNVSSLLELGSAFHPELTGRENVYLNGAVLGLRKRQIDAKIDEIIRFSELEEFIDSPLKAYSDGMCLRLGFSIAIAIEAEILLIDEALTVGDYAFQKKCLEKLNEFKKQRKTIIFVSHDIELVSRLCERVIFLKNGKVIADGQTDEAIALYLQTLGDKKRIAILKKDILCLIFNNGKCILCWDNKRLTKSMGIYTSLRSQGIWNESINHAFWEVVEINNTTMVIRGQWMKLPIAQVWKFKIEDDHTVSWGVEMQIKLKIILEREQTNIMLREEYKTWSTNDKKGKFPEDFSEDYHGDWESMYKGNPKITPVSIDTIRSENLSLPSVTFDFSTHNDGYVANIVNSDRIHRARVLQCLKVNEGKKAEFEPGTYKYFTGKIKITGV